MADTRFDSARGTAAAVVRWRRVRLMPEDVEDALGDLATPQDCQRWITCIMRWALAGLVAGTTAQAIASLLREWLKAQSEQTDVGLLRDLEHQINSLREEFRRGGRR